MARRKQRPTRQLLTRLAACETCVFLVSVSYVMEATGTPGAVAECPTCQRELLIPMSPAGIGQELFEKALRTVASYLEHPPNVRITHLRFTLNDQEILADPGWQDGNALAVSFHCPERDFAKLRPLQ